MKTLSHPLLFDQPGSHRGDPVTSYIAAEKLAKSGGWRTQKKAVYETLKLNNGCTSAELGRFMGSDRFMPARRLPELVTIGFVVQGPVRICKVTHQLCVTWWLTGTLVPKEKP